MTLVFTEEERDYIVNNHETDLVLTEVGMQLIEKFTRTETGVSINATEADVVEFFAELKEEYRCKVERIFCPNILRLPGFGRQSVLLATDWGPFCLCGHCSCSLFLLKEVSF